MRDCVRALTKASFVDPRLHLSFWLTDHCRPCVGGASTIDTHLLRNPKAIEKSFLVAQRLVLRCSASSVKERRELRLTSLNPRVVNLKSRRGHPFRAGSNSVRNTFLCSVLNNGDSGSAWRTRIDIYDHGKENNQLLNNDCMLCQRRPTMFPQRSTCASSFLQGGFLPILSVCIRS